MRYIEKAREYTVAKSNDLIQKSRYDLTLQQQKLLLAFISKIKPTDEASTRYTMEIRDYCEICGINEDSGGNYSSIKDNLNKIDLYTTWINVNGAHVRLRWFNKLVINPNDGTITISFHEDMFPFLFDLQMRYCQYPLVHILPMHSKYSVRLYELLASYKGLYRKELELGELRSLLCADTYPRWANFNDRVLKPAVKEINEYSDLNVTCSARREGRSVKYIMFTIEQKNELHKIATGYKRRKVLNKG